MSEESACDQVQRLLGELLDCEVEAVQARVLREHVAHCELCADRQAAEVHVRQIVRERVQQRCPSPPNLRARILVSIHRETLTRISKTGKSTRNG